MATSFWDDDFGPDASRIEDNLYSLNPWDYVKFDGVRTPGLVDIPIANPAYRLDKKASKGRHGNKLTVNGYESAKLDITIHIWMPEQLDAMDSLISDLWPVVAKKNPTPIARKIEHPALNAWHIKTCAVIGATTYRPSSRITGGMQLTIKCEEYEPINTKKNATTSIVPPKIKGESGANFTTFDNRKVFVKPANAQSTAPSQSTADTGPVSQSIPAI